MRASKINLQDRVQELFFLIAPPPHIMSDVSVLKDDVHYLIGRQLEDRFSRGHIPLFKYADQHMDDMLMFVEEKVNEFKPFNVFIKDFGVLYQGRMRTIYLDIINKYPIRDIFEKLIREDSNYIPHLTIARNLSEEDFIKTWPYLKGLRYSQHFTCDRITVLARTGKRWMHFRDIVFPY